MTSSPAWWSRFTTPSADGLPAARVLGAGILVFFGAWVILVLTSVNGTSSGAFYPMIYTGSDPALLLGAPNLIRTDEWNVQTVWAISQVQQGLPLVNRTFPGGMDATIPQDLPRLDWSVVFRPHLWGFTFLDVDHAQAWKWWTPLLGLAITAYTFILVEMPRRPVVALLGAIAISASPFLHWWFLQTTLWPLAWGFATLAAVRWSLRSSRGWQRWLWAAGIGYLTVVTAMGIYVPFIIPVVLITALTALGMALAARAELSWRAIVRRLTPILIGGLSAGVVLATWLATRRSTVSAFLSTAYPGERLTATGQGGDVVSGAALLGSSFTSSLKYAGRFLDANASESATFFLPGIFLAPVIIWFAVQAWRTRDRSIWPLALTALGGVTLLAFIFIPGWDALAHLLLLDRSTPIRARIGLGFGSFVIVVLLLGAVSRTRRPGWRISAIGPALFIVSQVAIALALAAFAPDLLQVSGHWWVIALVSTFVILAAARGWAVTTMTTLALLGLAGTLGVNPLYRGVFDLRDTAPAREIMEIDAQQPGIWVGVGDKLVTALLLESGTTAFNGFQGAPNADMWHAIDPASAYEYEWNRLAGVSWAAGVGEPVVTNPAPDQILVSFDACSSFAQTDVTYVAADAGANLDTTCLLELDSVDVASTQITLWEVVPPPR